ncbi:MAG: TetR/AcrR family transcriptional regulator [Acidimicrobiia bacterium]
MAKSEAARPLRVDAARNRAAILHAAREAFAEHGTDVALDEIARRAGVGIATLYRRFPTREDLVAAAFEPKMCAYVAATQAAVAEPDPWEGFSGFVRTVCAMQAEDAGFADVVALTFPATAELDRLLRSATAGLGDVIERAKAAEQLRADFVMEDLVLLLMANAGVVNATKRHAPRAWERLAAYMLDAFRAPGATPLPRPIDPRRLSLAARRSAQRARSVSP